VKWNTLLFIFSLGFAQAFAGNQRLRISGSTTVAPIIQSYVQDLSTQGLDLLVDTQGGSSGGLLALKSGDADIAMVSSPLSEEHRKWFEGKNLSETTIAYDALAVIVSKSLFEAGVTKLSKESLQKIYESKVKSWNELGAGPDKPILFFNKEPGRGTWEVFVKYLYGNLKTVPNVPHPVVGSNQEVMAKVSKSNHAISTVSLAWAHKNDQVKALSLQDSKGEFIDPSMENAKNGKYPLVRPLILLTLNRQNDLKKITTHLQSASAKNRLVEMGFNP